jgi:uncharacterized protein
MNNYDKNIRGERLRDETHSGAEALAHWETLFRERMSSSEIEAEGKAETFDPAHDVLHIERVVRMAKRLALAEGASLDVVVPAAWLHDFVVVPKNDPRRSQASRLSAEAALEYLKSIGYPSKFYDAIAHAIEAHSFSAAIEPRTLEACIVQDADRLDGLGAIGLARLFMTAGLMRRQLYSEDDPFCTSRAPDDSAFTLDHIYRKLFVVADTLKTEAGRLEGTRRRRILESYLSDLALEI